MLSYANQLLRSYDKMLYDLLYVNSWRFRISHWACMIRDRPKMTLAKVLLRLVSPLGKMTGSASIKMGVSRLEQRVLNRTLEKEDSRLAKVD